MAAKMEQHSLLQETTTEHHGQQADVVAVEQDGLLTDVDATANKKIS